MAIQDSIFDLDSTFDTDAYFDIAGLVVNSSMTFSSKAKLDAVGHITTYELLVFNARNILVGKTDLGASSLTVFSTKSRALGMGFVSQISDGIVFSDKALLSGASYIGGRTALVFSSASSLGGRLSMYGFESLIFRDRAMLNGRFGLTSRVRLLTSSHTKLVRSPWQGVSQSGNAVYFNMREDANYNVSPYESRREL